MADLRTRIEQRVYKEENGCWMWLGCKYAKTGQAFISVQGKPMSVRRASYEAFNGLELTSDDRVVNECGTRLCVNPHHQSVRRRA